MVTVSAANAVPSGPVVLIGPLAVGKSTVGAGLASRLGVPMCSVDEVRWRYFDLIGYDRGEAERRFARGRTPAEKLAYGMPFEVYAIEQIMADRSHRVIDFGASNSVYDDAVLLARVEAALTGAYVVLLLPSKDPVTSERLLAARLAQILQAKDEDVTGELLALNSYFVRHPSNRRLARKVVYTSDRSPAAIASEIAHSLAAATPRPCP
jgi:hypothetical protein